MEQVHAAVGLPNGQPHVFHIEAGAGRRQHNDVALAQGGFGLPHLPGWHKRKRLGGQRGFGTR